jgi:RNA polymerase primary sigma factor
MRQLKIVKQITNRESQSLDKYLQEISKLDLIGTDMEVELAKRIKDGDIVALERLTKANLRFVVSVAKQYQHFGLSLGDLINDGNLGLIRAAKRFDETRGFKFISYAVWWIRQRILQGLAEHSRVVRLPLNRVGSLSKMLKTFSSLEQKYQREPSVQEVADSLGTTTEDITNSQTISVRHLSIDAPFAVGEENSLLEVLTDPDVKSPDSVLISDSMRIDIDRALRTLSVREAQVLSLYFGLNGESSMTLEELGARFNITRERVRQIKEKATRRLRQQKKCRTLRGYL